MKHFLQDFCNRLKGGPTKTLLKGYLFKSLLFIPAVAVFFAVDIVFQALIILSHLVLLLCGICLLIRAGYILLLITHLCVIILRCFNEHIIWEYILLFSLIASERFVRLNSKTEILLSPEPENSAPSSIRNLNIARFPHYGSIAFHRTVSIQSIESSDVFDETGAWKGVCVKEYFIDKERVDQEKACLVENGLQQQLKERADGASFVNAAQEDVRNKE